MRHLSSLTIPPFVLGFAAFLAQASSAGAQTLLPGIPSGPIPTGTGAIVTVDASDSEDSDE
ncbi:MAG TPA: hypothetical protein VFR10_04500, partial [bacterium]|nr:hypothetical protein [bacterium]